MCYTTGTQRRQNSYSPKRHRKEMILYDALLPLAPFIPFGPVSPYSPSRPGGPGGPNITSTV